MDCQSIDLLRNKYFKGESFTNVRSSICQIVKVGKFSLFTHLKLLLCSSWYIFFAYCVSTPESINNAHT